jgi:hypothetical protein
MTAVGETLPALLYKSRNPNRIMDQFSKELGLGQDWARPLKKNRRREARNMETQTDEVDHTAQTSASAWLFRSSPRLDRIEPELDIGDLVAWDRPPNRYFAGQGVDDGSYPSDPVLQFLRRRARTLGQ